MVASSAPSREQSAALIVVRKRHAPEAAAVNSRNPVMPRQPFVDERVVRVQQIEHAAILAQRAGDEQLRLLLERLQQALVVVGIAVRIDHHFLDAPQIQPLGGEIVDQRVGGARVGQHAPHFLFEGRRIRELSALGQRQQAIVGDAAPQEERQARGQFQIAQPIACLRCWRGSRWTRSRKSGSTSMRSSAN